MLFLPLLLVIASAVVVSFIYTDMKKDRMMAQYYKDIAEIEWENVLKAGDIYETEIYIMDEYIARKCS